MSKTKFMIFGKRRINTRLQIEIDGVAIERVNENKFLGVTIDDRLSWKPHITHVKYKVARSIAVINKAKQVLDHKSLHTQTYHHEKFLCNNCWCETMEQFE